MIEISVYASLTLAIIPSQIEDAHLMRGQMETQVAIGKQVDISVTLMGNLEAGYVIASIEALCLSLFLSRS
jgi:hypothetical protein